MSKTSIIPRLGCCLIALAASVTPVAADSSTPGNFINVNFAPITPAVSYDYDFSTGSMTVGTASGSAFSTSNLIQNTVADPSPPDPNGSGTFIGTARPVKSPTGGGAVLYEQSVCGSGYPTCFGDGTFTFGTMVMRHLRGATLDQLTTLATNYFVDGGSPGANCFGGGSPRFQVDMSNGKNIFVYLGTYPAFADCPPHNTWLSTGNFATDLAGLRWDDSQLTSCGTFYQLYSQAVTCANSLGLTISEITLVTDGGWFGTNDGPTGPGQTFFFDQIQTNGVTRFP